MARYPNKLYPPPGGPSASWTTNQYVGNSNAIAGSSSGGVTSVTETWQGRGISEQNKGNTSLGAGAQEPSVKTWGYIVESTLGYATSKGVNLGIARTLPMRHPEIPSIYASTVNNLQGIGANGQSSILRAAWKQIRFDITYETPPYNILDDAAVAAIAAGQGAPAGSPGEQYRYVIPDFDPSVEFIQRRKGSFRFPQINDRGGVLLGRAIPDSHGASLRLVKRKYTFTWCLVPDNGLFNNGGFFKGGFAVNIENALGKVNADTFFGYAPGTVLFEGWKPIPRTYPRNLMDITQFPRCWDVRLTFNHFNPPTDPNDPAQNTNVNIDGVVYNVKTGGHNAVPHPTNGYWYRAILQDTKAFPKAALDDKQDSWKYRYTVFDKIFRMCAP